MSGYWGDFSFGPTASQTLRQEIPALMDKWNEYREKEKDVKAMLKHLTSFTFLERIFKSRSFIHVFIEWKNAREEYLIVESEYNFLEKLLQDS